MKKLMSILFVMILIAAALVLTDTIPLTVKGENVHDTFVTWVKEQQADEDPETGFRRLMDELWTAVDEYDLDSFIESCCSGAVPEDIEGCEDLLKAYQDYYKQVKGMSLKTKVIRISDTRAYAEWFYYTVSGSSCDGRYEAFALELVDHTWRFAEDGTDTWKAVVKKIDADLWDALENQRSTYILEPWLVVKNGFCYPGVTADNVSYAYQNEDGSLDVLIQYKNGTSKSRTIKNTKIQLKDENGKVILTYSTKDRILNPAHTSTSQLIHIDAAKIGKKSLPDYICFSVHTDY